jgi:hypothetical protein
MLHIFYINRPALKKLIMRKKLKYQTYFSTSDCFLSRRVNKELLTKHSNFYFLPVRLHIYFLFSFLFSPINYSGEPSWIPIEISQLMALSPTHSSIGWEQSSLCTQRFLFFFSFLEDINEVNELVFPRDS